ncbi:phosphoserine phosphatase [Palleronia aestuarii]|uniref:Phosphoserine phosphatase n=1 Tax=Palleronia aestuarii TaxID=568105 RepID=A0A2W7NK04_9RHOB|nr:haloacid dehalogenase-like hydrolase [Palleronia aestuarii]PZX19783.1 phosphoserine phosphatase [Palleronia aestuarii]
MPITRPYIPRLAFIFDFDLTLAGDSWNAVCAELGITRDEWRDRFRAPLGEGWDPIQQKAQGLLDAADALDVPLTPELFERAASRIEIFPGVLDMPARIRAVVEEIHAEIECEFIVLSSGFSELIHPTAVAKAFDEVHAGAFHMQDGRARCVKRTITHAEKALYIRAHAEGLSVAESNSPGTSDALVDAHDLHVPFDQIVYVGDGASDLQAFGYLDAMGGLTIGITEDGAFEAREEQSSSQRVDALSAPDYSDGAALFVALQHAARAGASRIALRS